DFTPLELAVNLEPCHAHDVPDALRVRNSGRHAKSRLKHASPDLLREIELAKSGVELGEQVINLFRNHRSRIFRPGLKNWPESTQSFLNRHFAALTLGFLRKANLHFRPELEERHEIPRRGILLFRRCTEKRSHVERRRLHKPSRQSRHRAR